MADKQITTIKFTPADRQVIAQLKQLLAIKSTAQVVRFALNRLLQSETK